MWRYVKRICSAVLARASLFLRQISATKYKPCSVTVSMSWFMRIIIKLIWQAHALSLLPLTMRHLTIKYMLMPLSSTFQLMWSIRPICAILSSPRLLIVIQSWLAYRQTAKRQCWHVYYALASKPWFHKAMVNWQSLLGIFVAKWKLKYLRWQDAGSFGKRHLKVQSVSWCLRVMKLKRRHNYKPI